MEMASTIGIVLITVPIYLKAVLLYWVIMGCFKEMVVKEELSALAADYPGFGH